MERPGPGEDSAEPVDVLIIGGGPAGATAAALLAGRGTQVLLLEKDRHPRFHIGESLLPRNVALFERLGVLEQVAAIGVLKPAAEFVSDEHGAAVAFPFSLARDARDRFAFQVPRAAFDQVLFANAAARGARTLQQCRAVSLRPAPPGGRALVHAVAAGAERLAFAPRFVLDASGRDTFLAGRLGLREPAARHASAAVYAHYRGAEFRTGEREGCISIHLARDGWFWMIPLPDGVMSVGFVAHPTLFKGRESSMAAFLAAQIEASPSVRARMRAAERISAVTATGNYSYAARTSWGEGYMMIGDAFAFLDPIFSSGVLFAMMAGEMGAAVAETWLADPRAGRALARRTERRLRRGMAALSWLITRINDPVLRDMFLSANNRFGMRDGLISLLAGDFERPLATRGPEFAFKAAYRMLSGLNRLGLRLHPDGQLRRAPGGLLAAGS